ncbi:FtsB family cell division protein [Eubacterium barkeri]|uniref:Septum formation initiator n=1 Tax=Eubacterium barkeri TaxID=1528 RepID=A0A1H3H3A1_EUBBA|nr:septum formation initiator family protein [Eubacterium barkeri]SDY09867.1 Septum formation initiator [Eubacterium barkeri]
MKAKFQHFCRWIYKQRATLLTIFVIGAVLLFLFGQNFYKIYRLEKQKGDLQSQITQEEERAAELNEANNQIGSKSYVEYIARKYLRLYYPEEKVVVTIPENKESQNAQEEQNKGENTTQEGETQ